MTIQPSMSLSDISSNGNHLNSLPTGIFKKLRNNDTEEKILQAGVEIIYETLQCDRVVVYSMESDSLCKITAEAVTPGYAQILNRTIKDVCFEAGYVEKYQKGRIKAIADVNNSSIADCHLEALKEIDVKANLVVPLVNRDTSLYGLLVMHQCSSSRQWRQTEVGFVLEMSEWIIAQLCQQQTNSSLKAQLASSEKAQELITRISTEIHATQSMAKALQVGVDKAREILNCDRVVVYCLQDQSMGKIVAESTVPALASILGNVIKDPCFEYRYIDKYEQGRISSISNIHEAGMASCYVENLAKIGVRSNLVAPINRDNGTLYGLLVAHQCFNFKTWQTSEINCFKEIALHTGLSLSKAELKEQFQLAKNGCNHLDNTESTIDLALTKLEQIKQPLSQTNQILVEISNLNKLLEREISLINQNSSLQTKKDTKLIQIMVRKLAVITSKLRESLHKINSNKNEVDVILNQASVNIKENKSVDD